ncbi:MAG: PQQ-like beta-propeller repeat protein [Candidatus Eisenbacteria bacterium]|uniref:PQQ-like beta-propeller repeat protein n=1 Tax=Eiseniibacteriota bacterium TaxID=2212470 RepID=A0A948W5B2_UNCEI|nr:PQQ-like beta-propeller repeat protein [Candidatus Eisenbacteria bacterium]
MRHRNKQIVIAISFVCTIIASTCLYGMDAHASSTWVQVNKNGFGSGLSYIDCLFTSSIGRTYASSDGFFYEYSGGTSWRRKGSKGFGNPENWKGYALAEYNGHLYVGTQNESGSEVRTWPSGAIDWVLANTPGWGDPHNWTIWCMTVYNGKLYCGTEGVGRVFSYDGSNWAQANVDGFGNPENIAVTSMAVHEGFLYAGVYNDDTGCEIWRYDGTNPWVKVNTSGFGSKYNHGSWALHSSSGSLFAGTMNWRTGGQVWEYKGGSDWTKVGQDGLGSEDNSVVRALVVFRGRLYAGTGNNAGGEVLFWDGANWIKDNARPLGDQVTAMTLRGDNLFAGNYTPNTGCQVWSKGSLPSWYLAEGSTAWGFQTEINIENPNTTNKTVTARYLPTNGTVVEETIVLEARSQTTLTNDYLIEALGGEKDFSTEILCEDLSTTIAVDRTMTWTGPGANSFETHASIGCTGDAKTWYLAEGSSSWGFETWLLIQNSGSQEANCSITYMIEGDSPVMKAKKIAANSRATFNMADDIGERDASIMIVSDVPIIPERSMYRNNRREGHGSIGTMSASEDYYLAEGTTDWGFTTYILIQNPNDSESDVTVTYMTESGPVQQPDFTIPASSRKTIRVNDSLPNTDFSTRIHGSQPIIAERAMYWGSDSSLGEACHGTIGIDAPHTVFYLPDGDTSNGCETWTLVQNPNDVDVDIEVRYYPSGGGYPITFTDTIEANSRKTYDMNDEVSSGRAAILVASQTSGRPIMVERAMYWNSRGAGASTIGGFRD